MSEKLDTKVMSSLHSENDNSPEQSDNFIDKTCLNARGIKSHRPLRRFMKLSK